MTALGTDMSPRVLIATTRDMGDCPCPRCTIKKADLHKLGSTADSRTRVDDARKADSTFRQTVAAARDMIYRKGYVVTSKSGAVGKLKNESLVPTIVRPHFVRQ